MKVVFIECIVILQCSFLRLDEHFLYKHFWEQTFVSFFTQTTAMSNQNTCSFEFDMIEIAMFS